MSRRLIPVSVSWANAMDRIALAGSVRTIYVIAAIPVGDPLCPWQEVHELSQGLAGVQ